MPDTQPRKRACVFCGNTPVTFEHVIPKWVSKLPAVRQQLDANERHLGRPHFLSKYQLGDSGGVVDVDFVERGRFFPMNAIEVPVVCGGCNQGWMSALESSVSQHLTPMVAGEIVELDRAALETLAKWAVKTAMMFEYNDRTTLSFTDEQRREFYRTKVVPSGVVVQAAYFDDENRLRLLHTGGKWQTADSSLEGTLGATAIVLGHLALLVWNASQPDMLGAVAARSVGRVALWLELWPDAPEGEWDSLLWSRRQAVGHLDIELAAGMLASPQ